MRQGSINASKSLHHSSATLPHSDYWAGLQDLTLPVVSMARSAPTLCLLARSPEEYLHRALAEEDSRQGQAGAVAAAAAAGSEGGGVYEQGAVSSSGVSLEAYLTRKVDMRETLRLRAMMLAALTSVQPAGAGPNGPCPRMAILRCVLRWVRLLAEG